MKTNKALLFILISLITLPFARAAEGQDSTARTNVPPDAPLTGSVNSVYNNYIQIQLALAEDSLKGVADSAKAMAEAVNEDKMKKLSAEVAKQAEELAKAKDLVEAREALQPLSESLIAYLADHDVKSKTYDEMYCPMANASWLQKAGDDTQNPYLGKSMPQCGTLKRTF